MASTTGIDVGAATSHKRRSDAVEEWPKKPRLAEKTDKTKWRLNDDDSRLTWEYLADEEAAKERPQSLAEKYFLGLPLVRHAPDITITDRELPQMVL